MKILLFGGSGQVGKELRQRAIDLNFEIFAPITSEVDVTDREKVKFLAQQIKPDIIINSAAYTAVDLAEAEKERAYAINHIGAENVAQAASSLAAKHIYISTDYVFDGEKNTPYKESDRTNPINIYGQSKLAGELSVRKILEDKSLIVRTSSVHGRYGKNIVHTICKLLETNDSLDFIENQTMSPTWAGWLAETLLDLAKINAIGTVHACCSGSVTWYEFASELLNITKRTKPEWKNKKINPVRAEDYPRPAKRPKYSVLDTSYLTTLLEREPLNWKVGLRKHLEEIGYDK